jgi:hypothetical protein
MMPTLISTSRFGLSGGLAISLPMLGFSKERSLIYWPAMRTWTCCPWTVADGAVGPLPDTGVGFFGMVLQRLCGIQEQMPLLLPGTRGR